MQADAAGSPARVDASATAVVTARVEGCCVLPQQRFVGLYSQHAARVLKRLQLPR